METKEHSLLLINMVEPILYQRLDFSFIESHLPRHSGIKLNRVEFVLMYGILECLSIAIFAVLV